VQDPQQSSGPSRYNRALPTETKIENGTSQSKSGTPVNLSKSGEQLECFRGILPESQDQNLALTVLHVPYSLDSGRGVHHRVCRQAPQGLLLSETQKQLTGTS
jgi:hypothetical protein